MLSFFVFNRLCLSALHYNTNADRMQAVTTEGRPKYAIRFPKAKQGEHSVQVIKTKATYGKYMYCSTHKNCDFIPSTWVEILYIYCPHWQVIALTWWTAWSQATAGINRGSKHTWQNWSSQLHHPLLPQQTGHWQEWGYQDLCQQIRADRTCSLRWWTILY